MMLVFLQIVSLTGLAALMQAATVLKRTQHHWQRIDYLQTGALLLRQAETDVMAGKPSCLIAIAPTASLAKKPVSWWKQYACSDKVSEIQYYYVVESLGKDDCGVVMEENAYWAADYYRITLLIVPDKMKGAKIMLQSTLVKSTGEAASCTDKMRILALGRQMSREI